MSQKEQGIRKDRDAPPSSSCSRRLPCNCSSITLARLFFCLADYSFAAQLLFTSAAFFLPLLLDSVGFDIGEVLCCALPAGV